MILAGLGEAVANVDVKGRWLQDSCGRPEG
jgi:hypothetical protein